MNLSLTSMRMSFFCLILGFPENKGHKTGDVLFETIGSLHPALTLTFLATDSLVHTSHLFWKLEIQIFENEKSSVFLRNRIIILKIMVPSINHMDSSFYIL